MIFTGGGYASGKGSVTKMLKARGEWPQGAMLLDPDDIKAELPEFQLSAMDDPEANLRVYSEAWDIAQEAMRQAQERRLNVVVDGITDTASEEVAKRVQGFLDHGYTNPRINYVSVATDEAIARARSRAAKGSKPADKRMIPEVIMRAVHRDVSATIPGVMARSKELGLTVDVYDTDQGKDPTTGQFNLPKLVASADPEGHISHPDSSAFQRIVNKANEKIASVPDVQGQAKGVWKEGGPNVAVNPAIERRVGQQLEDALPSVESKRLPGPTSDPTELLTAAQVKGLPELQALLRDFNVPLTEAASEGVAMDMPQVIVGPVKGIKRTLTKLAANGTPLDSSYLQDALATVTVPTAQELPANRASAWR